MGDFIVINPVNARSIVMSARLEMAVVAGWNKMMLSMFKPRSDLSSLLGAPPVYQPPVYRKKHLRRDEPPHEAHAIVGD